jgi:hypothetical protein
MLAYTQPRCGRLVAVSLKVDFQMYTRRRPDLHGLDGY